MKAGEFSSGEMAAVGASLAVVIVLCLVCIGVMVHRIKGHNTDWKKISEASVFQSTVSFHTKNVLFEHQTNKC